jgi:hypothetical protein
MHSTAGLEALAAPGATSGALPWEMSRSLFGGWDPLVYRYLTPQGDPLLDLGTPEWLMLLGPRHVGGGPATTSRDGRPLTGLAVTADDPETQRIDSTTGQPVAWDWARSGVEEMNCFLCHLARPNRAARTGRLALGAGSLPGQWRPAA